MSGAGYDVCMAPPSRRAVARRQVERAFALALGLDEGHITRSGRRGGGLPFRTSLPSTCSGPAGMLHIKENGARRDGRAATMVQALRPRADVARDDRALPGAGLW